MPKIHFNNKQCFYIGILFLFLSGLLFLVILLFHLKNFSKMEYLKDVRKSNVFAQMNASVMTDYFTSHYESGIEHKTYFIWDNQNVYLVDLNDKTRTQLNQIYAYSYSDEDTPSPNSVVIKGMAKEIPENLELTAIESINKILEREVVNEDNFKEIFGMYYLDTFVNPVSSLLENLLLVLPTLSIGFFFLFFPFLSNKK